jgi:CubicO group peptidase (beta-lactamase class C family)
VLLWAERALGSLGVELAEFNAALNPFSEPFDWNARETVQAVIPAANGQFTARSLARMYALLAGEGELDGVRLVSSERVREIGAVTSRARDRVLFIPMHWRMGYHRVFTLGARVPAAFGHYGYGGSGAFCDPSRNLAVALIQNGGSGTPMGNSSMPRIAQATIRAVDRLRR